METEAAAASVQAVGFIHPVMADVMTILSFVLVVASVGIAAVATHYAWRQTGGTVDIIEGHVSWLRTEAERLAADIQASVTKDSQTAEEVAKLKEQISLLEIRILQVEEQAKQFAVDIEELKERPAAAPPAPEPVSAPAPEPAPEPEEEIDLEALLESKPIWQDLLDDYHALRETFSPERGAELCAPIIEKYGLHLLICSDHAAVENGKAMPKFEAVDDVNEATFWAYDIPGQPNDFAVIPSPMFPYDQKMHEEAGMKETFAARYEEGRSYDKLTVDMPALFSLNKGKWNIEQPGLLKLEG